MWEAAGPLQLCAAQDGGCEAAVRAMRSIFQAPETEAVLLVDTNDALTRLIAKHTVSTGFRRPTALCCSILSKREDDERVQGLLNPAVYIVQDV